MSIRFLMEERSERLELQNGEGELLGSYIAHYLSIYIHPILSFFTTGQFRCYS